MASSPSSSPSLDPVQEGQALLLVGDARAALPRFQTALAAAPSAEGYAGLGSAYFQLGNVMEAHEAFRMAVSLAPNTPNYLACLGTTAFRLGQFTLACKAFHNAIVIDPNNGRYRSNLTHALAEVHIKSFDARLKESVQYCLEASDVDPQPLATPWLRLLQLDPALKPLADLMDMGDPAAIERSLDIGKLLPALLDNLVTAGLRMLLIPSLPLERVLTALRARLLLEKGGQSYTHLLKFLCALGEQNFLNEYVHTETPEETAAVESLKARIEAVRTPKELDAQRDNLALLACYRPLHSLKNADTLAAYAETLGSGSLKSLLTLQVREPRTETALRKEIKTIGAITDAISRQVQAQYEENPYPRWRGMDLTPFPQGQSIRNIDMLIAGCGTGRQIVQMRLLFPHAKILAVDLSLTSLAYAARKVRELGLKDIEIAQADILGLTALNRKFDVISCTGVLHHMQDPMAGWRVLTDLLKPHGVMNIALYSEKARTGIVAARTLIAEKGLPATLEGIRAFRAELQRLPADNPALGLRNSRDFFATSSCRDLAFHVQESRFTLPQLQESLDALDLKLLTFSLPSPRIAQTYRSRFPADTDMTDLNNWNTLETETPALFAGMYQFWCAAKSETGDQKTLATMIRSSRF